MQKQMMQSCLTKTVMYLKPMQQTWYAVNFALTVRSVFVLYFANKLGIAR